MGQLPRWPRLRGCPTLLRLWPKPEPAGSLLRVHTKPPPHLLGLPCGLHVGPAGTDIGTGTHRLTWRDRQRQRHRLTDLQTQAERGTGIYTQTGTHTRAEAQADRQTDRHTDIRHPALCLPPPLLLCNPGQCWDPTPSVLAVPCQSRGFGDLDEGSPRVSSPHCIQGPYLDLSVGCGQESWGGSGAECALGVRLRDCLGSREDPQM